MEKHKFWQTPPAYAPQWSTDKCHVWQSRIVKRVRGVTNPEEISAKIVLETVRSQPAVHLPHFLSQPAASTHPYVLILIVTGSQFCSFSPPLLF